MNACPNMPMQALLTNTISDDQYYTNININNIMLQLFYTWITKKLLINTNTTSTGSPEHQQQPKVQYVCQDKKPSPYHVQIIF